jgi:hypothetical protein
VLFKLRGALIKMDMIINDLEHMTKWLYKITALDNVMVHEDRVAELWVIVEELRECVNAIEEEEGL